MALTGAVAAAVRQFDPYPEFATALVFKGRPETGGRPFYKHRGIIAPRFEMLPGAFSLGNAGLAWRPVNGAMRRAAADEPVIGDDGILHHEARPNSIRNPVMAGAVVGSPGTFPTNWGGAVLSSGLNRQIVGIGVENGLPFVDVRIFGTLAGAGDALVLFDNASSIAAANGQAWTSQANVSLVAGALVAGVFHRQEYRDSGGNFLLSTNVGSSFLLDGTLREYRRSRTIATANTAFIRSGLYVFFSAAGDYDFTIRIAAPNLKSGPDINDPPILQETGLPATRTLPVQGLEGGLPQGPLTVIATQGAVPNVAAAGGGLPRFFELSNSDNTRALLVLRRASNGFNIEGVGGDNGAGNNSSLTPVNSTARARVALSFDGTSLTAAANGQAGPAATPSASISALSRLFLQNNQGGSRTANSNLEDLFIASGAVSAARLAEVSAL